MERKLCNKASDCESENKKGHLGKINKQESFKGVRKKIKQNKTKTDKKKSTKKKKQINHPEGIGENTIKTNNTKVK